MVVHVHKGPTGWRFLISEVPLYGVQGPGFGSRLEYLVKLVLRPRIVSVLLGIVFRIHGFVFSI